MFVNRIERLLPDAPQPRARKLREIRKRVLERSYESDEKLSRAVHRLLEGLKGP